MLSRREFWSWICIPGCSLPLKAATPNCSWSLVGGESKDKFSVLFFWPAIHKLFIVFWWLWKTPYGIQVPRFSALVNTPSLSNIWLRPNIHSNNLVHFRLTDAQRKNGRDDGSLCKHFLPSPCVALQVFHANVRNNFCLKMPKGNLVPIWEKMDLAVTQSDSSTCKNLVRHGPTSGQTRSEIVSLLIKYLSVTG